MIIRVNLLPRHFAEKRVVRNLALVFVVILAAIIFGMLSMLNGLNRKYTELSNATVQMQAEAAKVTALEAEVSKITSPSGEIAVTKERITLIDEIDKCNEQWVGLLNDLARYTYSKVTYRSIAPTTTAITIDAETDSVSSLGRYLLGMLRCDRFTYVSINQGQIPSYPKGGEGAGNSFSNDMMMPTPGGMPGLDVPNYQTTSTGGGISFKVVCTLKEALKEPALLAAGQQGADAGGVSGMMPMPGGVPAGGGMPGEAPGAPPMP